MQAEPHATQARCTHSCLHLIVRSAQVFAYGQTGSGKTYTMGTAASVKEVSGKGEATGVIPRCIKSIFATMQQARADYDVNMKVHLLLFLQHVY